MAPREKVKATKKNKAAVYGKHWVMAPTLAGQKTDGNGYCCLIADSLKCTVFTKHVTLVNHMLDNHKLNAGAPPRGRPKTSTRVRAPLTKEAKQKQKDLNLGNFPSRLWVAKKNQMLRSLKWAHNMWSATHPDGEPWKFVLKKAERVYVDWRQGNDFLRTMNTTVGTVRKYWADPNIERATPLDKHQIQKKSALPKPDGDYESEDGMPKVDVGRSNLETPQFYFHKRKLKSDGPHSDMEDSAQSAPTNEEDNWDEDEPIPAETKKGKSVSSAKNWKKTSAGNQIDPSDAVPRPDLLDAVPPPVVPRTTQSGIAACSSPQTFVGLQRKTSRAKRSRQNEARLHELNEEPSNAFFECYDMEANGLAELIGSYALQTGKERILEKIEQELGIQRFQAMLEEPSRSRAPIEAAFLPAISRFRKAIIGAVQSSTEALVDEVIKVVVIKELRKKN